MGQRNNNSAGFTLIAALLILVLLSGVAAGLIYLVTNESRMSGNDLETNLAYYGAESGMEKLTADVSAALHPVHDSDQRPDSEPDQLSSHAGHGQRHELHRDHYVSHRCQRQSGQQLEHG